MGKYKDIMKETHTGTSGARSHIPGVYQAFGDMYRAVYADGELSAKIKELMAVAIAIQDGCDGCIASHVRSAVRKGASAQEMAETIGVAIQMGGGPASIYGAHAWNAFQEFSETASTSTPT